MKFWKRARRRQGGGCRFAAAGLMLLLWLGTFALAASPQLHALFHEDCQGPEHHCLVTQIQHHSLLAGLAPVAAPAQPVAAIEVERCADCPLPHDSDYRLSPSRAPPLTVAAAAVAG